MCYLIDVWTDTTGSSVISAVCVSEVYISRDALVRSHDVKHEKWSVSRKRLNSLCRQTFQPFSFYCSKPRITTHVSPSSTSETVSANMLCAGVQALMRGIHCERSYIIRHLLFLNLFTSKTPIQYISSAHMPRPHVTNHQGRATHSIRQFLTCGSLVSVSGTHHSDL